jgi:dynein heavy chain
VVAEPTNDLLILGMCSSEGEVVSFTEPIHPNKASTVGRVELWMGEVERGMRSAVARCLEEALLATSSTSHIEWVLGWPSQAVLAVVALIWTAEMEAALQGRLPPPVDGCGWGLSTRQAVHVSTLQLSPSRCLDDYEQELTLRIRDIVLLVRGQLTRVQRCTLSALLVVDVHARDVVEELKLAAIDTPAAFEWKMHMRYYFLSAESTSPALQLPSAAGISQPSGTISSCREMRPLSKKKLSFAHGINVRIMNCEQAYGYEYLGASGRLVVTPLTLRCFRTLMGALQLGYGGAPSGPAGTGKTETIKDLSKGLAAQCVVFNCSEGLDHLAMEKFFKV